MLWNREEGMKHPPTHDCSIAQRGRDWGREGDREEKEKDRRRTGGGEMRESKKKKKKEDLTPKFTR